LDANTRADRLAIEALDSTLDIFNPNGKQLILELLQKQVGLPFVVQREANISKNKIELALITILGPDISRLLIQEWNRKITKAEI
jgi:hypothetical protein